MGSQGHREECSRRGPGAIGIVIGIMSRVGARRRQEVKRDLGGGQGVCRDAEGFLEEGVP